VASAAVALVFVNWALFRMTRFPPGPLLVILGIILTAAGSVMPDMFLDAIILATPILLGTILFGCGLRINLISISRNTKSAMFSFLTLVLTISVICGFSVLVLGMNLQEAVVVGAMGTVVCSFFVSRTVMALNIAPRVANSLVLEGPITEAVSILVALVAIGEITTDVPMLQGVVFGGLFGLLIGMVWVRLVQFTSDFPYKNSLTLSLGLGLIAFCEMVFPNSGFVSALFFGLSLGNANLLKTKIDLSGLMKFQGDIVMVMGTFFFFYLGLSGAANGFNIGYLFIGGAIWAMGAIVRGLTTYISLRGEGFNLPIMGIATKGVSVVLIGQVALINNMDISDVLFSFAIPLVFLGGILTGVCSLISEGKRAGGVEEITYLKVTKNAGHIKHAYDIEEMKKTIEKEII
ncbi:MAG: cation:proton antiporter, partial [Candidatus Micrarchaeota archaeon]